MIPIVVFLAASCFFNKEKKLYEKSNKPVKQFVLPFEPGDVKLLEGPFKKSAELSTKLLLNYEPDFFLAKLRAESRLAPKAEYCNRWEDTTITLYNMGHYLGTCAIMYRTTGDIQFLERVNYIVDELDSCMATDTAGYIGSIPGRQYIVENQVTKEIIRYPEFHFNGKYVPFCTLHKLMTGLRDAYRLCNNQKALDLEKKYADQIENFVIQIPESSLQIILQHEHGGINEVMADLYSDTGDDKYLRLSRKFHHKAILDSLLHGIDILPGIPSYTLIPDIIGLARRYELTGDSCDRKTAEFFWNRVVYYHSYATGGHGNYDYFGIPGRLRDRLGPNTTASGTANNMLTLTNHIFSWTASAGAADFYERTLLNHILSSQHPADGSVAQHLSLDMGGFKEYQHPFFLTCCMATGIENLSTYGGAIYFKNDNELFINQFIASELTWKEKGLVLSQNTKFPEEQGSSFTLKLIRPVGLTINIRYPYWAKNGITIEVNDRIQEYSVKPGNYIQLTRTWKNNDKIEVRIPFSLRLESMPDDKNRVAVMYGPLLLAGDLGPEGDPNMSDLLYVPVFLTHDRDPANWAEPVKGKVNEFLTKGVGRPRDVMLKPFYLTHERTYSVYWDLFTARQWENLENDYNAMQARKRQLQPITFDFINAGDTLEEQKHNLKSEQSVTGLYKLKPYRESHNGWFSYEVKVPRKKPTALVVEYHGGYPGAKTFDITVNNYVIATEDLSSLKSAQFKEIQYVIPENLTLGKKNITVKFRSHEDNTAGPVFSIRLITI
ncbi:MAG: glycoside hydrolase family 127 protein [Bacteroidales bacterium]